MSCSFSSFALAFVRLAYLIVLPSICCSESLDNLDWLLNSPIVTSLDGPIAGRASQYLRIMLERHDDASTFYRYRQAVLEKLLEADRTFPIPSFLVEFFSVSPRSFS